MSREREVYMETLRFIPAADMVRLFKKAATLGAGIELNANDMAFSDDETDVVLRPYHIAKACGCKFYCGSDAHRLKDFAKVENFARAIDWLGLEKTDKFHI
jgi:histidinol phosphatase-like PHP family hydrolase